MADTSDIDRLIDEGLNRYGAGDLDGAMLAWEEALAIDPDNAQANSYVDYVRLNYELLTAGEPSVEESSDGKFAIEEEPEHVIDVVPEHPSQPNITTQKVELPPAAALMALGDVDAGWDLEETHDTSAAMAGPTIDDDAPADPPGPPDPVNFEVDATREYHGVSKKDDGGDFNSDDFAAGDANPHATPVGFSQQETGIRQRDLGFVKATAAPRGSEPDLELGQYDATQERAPRYTAPTDEPSEDDDLIASLPTPRREPESGEIVLPKAATREMPEPVRSPARRESSALSQAEVMLPHAPTRELTPNEIRARTLQPSTSAPTRELLPSDVRQMVNAPTRELGLRPPQNRSPISNPDATADFLGARSTLDDELPTGQSDARAIRAAAARDGGHPSRSQVEGTRQDIVLPFDPIVAQAAQILDDVDMGAPAGEPADERTRRRITRLLELAGDWSETGALDKAVSAVDLALSEDPNSALGQKLITRNKDTIMSLFQSYLGDLDRMPQLAKPLHELASAPISPRAAFLLSRIDGTLTIDELLDVSGMPRLEAYRHLCQLYLRGILR